jgi:hypothetical protein
VRLGPFIKQDKAGKKYIIFRIDKTMYGLKEAGKLSNLRLNFYQTNTPGLFRHSNRPIAFVLVVDDFGVKYHHLSDFFLPSLSPARLLYTTQPLRLHFLRLILTQTISPPCLPASVPMGLLTLPLLSSTPLPLTAPMHPSLTPPSTLPPQPPHPRPKNCR